ncbi:hypothetical protein BS78_01G270800 [Paspalum vaginatum]|nr:hypothetical protein BS78_01G270800 [Paspalum vaginatum]
MHTLTHPPHAPPAPPWRSHRPACTPYAHLPSTPPAPPPASPPPRRCPHRFRSSPSPPPIPSWWPCAWPTMTSMPRSPPPPSQRSRTVSPHQRTTWSRSDSSFRTPDPDVSIDSAFTASAAAASCITEVEVEVASRAGSISISPDDDHRAESLPEEISTVLAELRGAHGLSPRSRRLLSALTKTAAFELATTRRLCRATFWGKVRVVVLSVTLATVAIIDVALAAYMHRVNSPPDGSVLVAVMMGQVKGKTIYWNVQLICAGHHTT